VAPASALENRLHRTDPEEPAAVRRTATPLGSHPSSQGDAEAYWESASARALVQVAVGRRGDVVSACQEDVVFEVYEAYVQNGPDVHHPCQATRILDPCRSKVSGRNASQTPYLP
jgi:hypothetical protein